METFIENILKGVRQWVNGKIATINTAIEGKQDTLTAGDNIEISGNTISVTGLPEAIESGVTEILEPITYTISSNINELDERLIAVENGKQGTLTPGTGITISGNTISVTEPYTAAERAKLDGIASGAQVNVIEEVQVNGTALTPSNKSVNIVIPAATVTGVKSGDNVLALDGTELTSTITLEYDSSAKTITLKGINGTEISQIDATDFVKDGMLISADIYKKSASGWSPSTPTGGTVPTQNGTYIRFEWNTDAGSLVNYLNVNSLIREYSAGDGLTLSGDTFNLDVATKTSGSTTGNFGGVIVGEGIQVDANGEISIYTPTVQEVLAVLDAEEVGE